MKEKVGANAGGRPARPRRRHLPPGGAQIAAEQGIVIADTEVECGWRPTARSIADELLTPDSSRFWPTDCLVTAVRLRQAVRPRLGDLHRLEQAAARARGAGGRWP